MSSVEHWNESDFEIKVQNGICILDFWAEWCGPCKIFGQILEEISREISDDIHIGKIDVDQCPGLAAKFGINSIPAIFITKNGKIVKEFIGVQTKEKILSALTEL